MQLALFRAATGDLDGVEVELGSIRATPGGLSLRDLQVNGPSYSLAIAETDIDLAVWSSLVHWRVEIEKATLTDVTLRVDATRLPTGVEAGDADRRAEPWAGLRDLARLPGWLALREADANGTLVVVTEPGATIDSEWQALALDWLPESPATATLTGQAYARQSGETLAAVTLRAEAGAEITADLAIDALTIAGSLDTADGGRGLLFDASGDLSAELAQYAVRIDSRAGQALVDAGAEVDSDRVHARWRVDLPSGIIGAFARGRSVADLTATSSGELTLDRSTRSGTVMAAADVLGSGWEAFDPRLQDLGTLTLTAAIDADIAPGMASARTARIALASESRGDLLHIESLQPLRFETGSWLVDPQRWGEPALRAVLDDMPLRWLRRFDPSGSLVDGRLSLAIEVIRDGERETRLVATEPIVASQIELAPVRGNEVPSFRLTLAPEATLHDGMLDAEIDALTIAADNGLSVSFTGSGHTSRSDWPGVAFEGALIAHVPALQRIVAPLQQLRASTRLTFDFESLLLRIAGISASAERSDGQQFLAIDLSGQSPLEIQLPTFRPDWRDFEPQAVTLMLDGMPIDWLNPYLPEIGFSGGELSGRLKAEAAVGRGVRLTADTPLVIENLTPAFRGRSFTQPLLASVNPTLELGNDSSRLTLDELKVDSRNGDSLRGDISISADAGADSIAFDVALDGDFPTLAARSGAKLGTMRYRHRGSIDPAQRRLDIDRFELEFSDVSDDAFLRIEGQQPFFVTVEPFAVGTNGRSPDILRATVTPLRLEQLLPKIFAFDLEGVLPQGEFFARADADGALVLAADDPLLFRDVTMHWQDAELLDRVTMSVRYEIRYSNEGIEARSVDISAVGPSLEPMLELSTKVLAPLTIDRTWQRASFQIAASLPALADQPILADLPHFTSGTVVSNIELTNENEMTAAASASMRDAETVRLGRLPDIDIGLDLAGMRGRNARIDMPLTLHSPEYGDSDLRLSGTLIRDDAGVRHIESEIVGRQLVTSDFSKLLDLLSADDSTARAGEADRGAPGSRMDRSALARLRTERHEKPVWTDRLAGSAAVSIGQLVFPSLTVEGLAGRFDLSPVSASLVDFEASLLEARVSAGGSLAFDAARPSPYSLDFSATIDDLDVGQLFRIADPTSPPTAEGLFDFATELAGSGRNPLDLALSTLGEVSLTGDEGIFRGLNSVAGTGSTASRVIGVLTFSRELRALSRLLDGLGEIRFEEADVRLTRVTANRVDLDRLSLRAPQVWLQASGDIDVLPQQPLLLSPLDLTARISARGDVAVLLDGMSLLADEDQSGDYRPMTKPIQITGTAAEPDASEFWALLDEGAENARGAFGVGLRALDRKLQGARTN